MATVRPGGSTVSPPDAVAHGPASDGRRLRYLVIYYSWSGRTAAVAEAVAEVLEADIEAIREAKPRHGLTGYIRAAVEASRRRSAPILPPSHRPEDYDVVILGTPVWAGAMSSPIRSLINRQRSRLPKIALFCTLGGSGAETTLEAMAHLCNRSPLARLSVTQAAMRREGWQGAVEDFAHQIRAKADPKPEPAG